MAKYLDYSGLKRFKDHLDEETRKKIADALGTDEPLKYSTNDDIDTVLDGKESNAEDKILTLHSFEYYHNLHKAEMMKNVADSLVLGENGEKSEIYENVEKIIDDKLDWKKDFPTL